MKHFLLYSFKQGALLVALLVASTMAGYGAPITVKGRVVDAIDGEAMIGVTIFVKDQTTGAVTDVNGDYILPHIEPDAVLEFSYVGYATMELNLNGRTTLDVSMAKEVKNIDEVVVIGYGKTTKKEVTGSITTVKAESFNSGSFTDAMGLLQGKVAGLSITSPNGADPQSGYQLMLRGTNTLTSGQGPLIIIDGVAGADLKNINFQDVESVDVLKDGSAAAIYGTRGTNGVMIITTKRAREGKTTVEYQGQVSAQVMPVMVENMTATQFKDAITKYAPERASNIYGGDTDWFAAITRKAPISHRHNLAISGGTKLFSHRTTLNIEQNQGLLKNNDVGKILAKTNIRQTTLGGWLDIDYNLFVSMRNYNPADYDLFKQAFLHNPTENIYDPEAEKWGGYSHIDAIGYYNPVAMQNERQTKGTTNDLGGNVRATLNVLAVPGLSWINFVSYEQSDYQTSNYYTRYYPTSSVYGRDGVASISNGKSDNLQYESTLNYIKNFGKHNLQLLAGYTYQHIGANENYMKNSGFDTDRLGTDDIGSGSGIKEGIAEMTSYREGNKLISFFGRAMYNYDERYLISASIRREGSSRFGVNNKWGWFPAVSVGWRINQEPFMRTVKWVDDLKVRAGYGATGNQDFANYKSLTMMGVAGKFFYENEWINTYQPTSNSNPDLRWEKKHEINMGVDFSFFNSRLGGSIDYYYRKSTDLLYTYAVSVPPYLYDEMFTNVGEISNQGIEVMIYGTPVKTRNFNWVTNLTFARNTNTLDKFSNEQFTNGSYKTGWLDGDVAVYSQRMEEGKSLGSFYGPVWEGVDKFGEDKLKGQMPDGRVDESKWEVIGNAYPDFTIGWSNTFQLKNWDLGFTLRASIGGDVLNEYRLYYENINAMGVRNIVSSYLDNTDFKGYSKYSSKYIEDATYLKLDNLTIGYNFKFNSSYVSNLRLYLAAQNLFCLTAYKGLDPEVSLSGLEPGIDRRSYYPRTTTITFGVNVAF